MQSRAGTTSERIGKGAPGRAAAQTQGGPRQQHASMVRQAEPEDERQRPQRRSDGCERQRRRSSRTSPRKRAFSVYLSPRTACDHHSSPNARLRPASAEGTRPAPGRARQPEQHANGGGGDQRVEQVQAVGDAADREEAPGVVQEHLERVAGRVGQAEDRRDELELAGVAAEDAPRERQEVDEEGRRVRRPGRGGGRLGLSQPTRTAATGSDADDPAPMGGRGKGDALASRLEARASVGASAIVRATLAAATRLTARTTSRPRWSPPRRARARGRRRGSADPSATRCPRRRLAGVGRSIGC